MKPHNYNQKKKLILKTIKENKIIGIKRLTRLTKIKYRYVLSILHELVKSETIRKIKHYNGMIKYIEIKKEIKQNDRCLRCKKEMKGKKYCMKCYCIVRKLKKKIILKQLKKVKKRKEKEGYIYRFDKPLSKEEQQHNLELAVKRSKRNGW